MQTTQCSFVGPARELARPEHLDNQPRTQGDIAMWAWTGVEVQKKSYEQKFTPSDRGCRRTEIPCNRHGWSTSEVDPAAVAPSGRQVSPGTTVEEGNKSDIRSTFYPSSVLGRAKERDRSRIQVQDVLGLLQHGSVPRCMRHAGQLAPHEPVFKRSAKD